MGDDVQALKAGVMEIADIFVVNKADREGADRAVASLETLLSLQAFDQGAWRPPVLRTEATTGVGIAALVEAIERFRSSSAIARASRRRVRTSVRIRDLVSRLLLAHVQSPDAGARRSSTRWSIASRHARSTHMPRRP